MISNVFPCLSIATPFTAVNWLKEEEEVEGEGEEEGAAHRHGICFLGFDSGSFRRAWMTLPSLSNNEM